MYAPATHDPPPKFGGTLIAKFENELHNNNNKFVPLLAKAEELTRVKRLYLVLALLLILAIYLIVGYAAQLLCNLLGFVYPAYRSLKALETSSKDDDTKWLIYWTTFGLFNVFEFFSDALWNWFPPYYLVKIIFLVWLWVPIENNGSAIIYNKIIRPFFLNNHIKIDQMFGSVANTVSGAVQTTFQEAKKLTSKDKSQ